MKKVKIIALIAAAATMILMYLFLNTVMDTGDGDQDQVLVAVSSIPANTTITQEMIALKELPVIAIHEKAFHDEDSAIGKVSKAEILAGEQILEGKLVTAGEKGAGTLAYSIEPGMRAITIAVDETTGLSGMLKPLNTIDILADVAYQAPGNGEPEVYTTLLAENISILAVDSVQREEGKTSNDGSVNPYITITLEVSPQQAMEISNMAKQGDLRAILRSPTDEENTNLNNITLDNVML